MTAGVPVNPPAPVTVTTELVEFPCWTLALVAPSATVMVGAAVTVSVKVVVTVVTPLPVAFTVIGYVPTGVAIETFSVTVPVDELPVVWIEETVAVTPVGRPVTVTAGVPVNPPAPVTVTVEFVEFPCWTLALVAPSATVMVGVGATGSSEPEHAWRSPKAVATTSADKRYGEEWFRVISVSVVLGGGPPLWRSAVRLSGGPPSSAEAGVRVSWSRVRSL